MKPSPKQKVRKVKAWCMYLKAYYPVFVCAFEAVASTKTKPPKNHAFAKYFEDCGQEIIWKRGFISYLQ